LVNDPGVEIHIGIKLPGDEILVLKGDPLKLQCDFEFRILARDFEDFVRSRLDDAGARVVALVYSMAKTH
jgi:hypothetical protein